MKDVDTGLNQRGDDIAAVMGRTDILESQTNGPGFMVKRSSNGQSVPAESWTQLVSGAWATPFLNDGFTWTGGSLTIPRAGIYDVRAHVMWRNDDFRTASINVTRNSTVADTQNTVAGNETTVESPSVDQELQLGVTAAEFVPLNAGDVLRVFTLQRNRGGTPQKMGNRSYDLTFNVLWVRELSV
ncbi:hypothetical protein NY537_14705 [Curtobacterium flaccumfaciens pv. betae]|nr:hypothetical protein [Curtobacterium flaccumfaciens pv. betae]